MNDDLWLAAFSKLTKAQVNAITHARDGGSVNDGRHVLTRDGKSLGRYDAFEAWDLVRREKAAIANKEGV